MDYKCRYNGHYGCENCKHGEEDGLIKCKMKNKYEIQCLYLSCPVVAGCVYPEGENCCNMCMFEPKEDDKEMIMTDEEMDEQLEMMERLEEEGYYDEFIGEWVRVEDSLIDDGLITVKLSKEQIKNILEFFDLRFIYFIQDQGNEIDNIWYLESMSTAYATLARAIGQEPKGA